MKKKINIIIQKIKEYKAFMYVLISICFSGLVDLFFTEMMIFDNYYLSFIISFLIVLLVAFIIDFVIYMYKLPRKTTLDDARDKINQAGSKFIIPGKEAKDKDPTNQMFYLAENEYDLVKKHSTEATDKNKPNEMRNIVYYSLSVKKYLNWIDYSYFKFLADLKKELKCDVIICVHYNDEMRETMSSSHINQKYYKELRAWYISIIKKIIGEDTLIAYEDHIFKVKHKKYVNEFHYYFNQQVINETSNMLDNKKPEDIENENYSNFKRKLSNLESVFPIAMIAEKYTKNKRLFVLDNIKNLENNISE